MINFDEKTTLRVIGWTDYDDNTFPKSDNSDEVIYAVAKELREHNYMFGGDSHQENNGCCPVLSNGTKACFSWRNWGLVVAVAYDIRGRDGNYDHLCGYMDTMINDDYLNYPGYRPVNYSLLKLDRPQNTFKVVLPVSCSVVQPAMLFALPCTEQLEQLQQFDYLNIFDALPEHDGYYKKEIVLAIYRGKTLQEAIDIAEENGEEIWGVLFGCPENCNLNDWFYSLYPQEAYEKGVVVVRGDWVVSSKFKRRLK